MFFPAQKWSAAKCFFGAGFQVDYFERIFNLSTVSDMLLKDFVFLKEFDIFLKKF